MTAEIAWSLFANSQNTHVEGCSETLTREFDLSDCAWSDARSIATSCEPRPTLISCVAATMLRTTTVSNAGFVAPQYFVLRLSVTCEVVLYAESTYGPLPAPTDAEELSH